MFLEHSASSGTSQSVGLRFRALFNSAQAGSFTRYDGSGRLLPVGISPLWALAEGTLTVRT